MSETAVATRNDSMPATFDEVSGLAKAFVTSGYFTDTRQMAQAIVKIQAGRELGLAPVFAMQNINLIRNRLCSSANTLALLVKRSGKYNYRIKEHTDSACSITFYEDGKDVGESTFTIEDARRADLIKPDSGWVKYPRAMLFSRAISQGARIYCPDAIGGIYTDEEMRSIPPRPEEEAVQEAPAAEVVVETPAAEPPAPRPEVKKKSPLVEAAKAMGAVEAPAFQNVGEFLTKAYHELDLSRSNVLRLLDVQSMEEVKDLSGAWLVLKNSA
jgi:hypothetical protein